MGRDVMTSKIARAPAARAAEHALAPRAERG